LLETAPRQFGHQPLGSGEIFVPSLLAKATQKQTSLALAQYHFHARKQVLINRFGPCTPARPFRAAGEMSARHRSMGWARVAQAATEGKQSVPRTSVPRLASQDE
jgi:hypothetical protein